MFCTQIWPVDRLDIYKCLQGCKKALFAWADTEGGRGTFAPPLNLEFFVPIFRVASQ